MTLHKRNERSIDAREDVIVQIRRSDWPDREVPEALHCHFEAREARAQNRLLAEIFGENDA